MKKSDLVDLVAQRENLPKPQVEKTIDAFLEAVAEGLSKGERIDFRGFGAFTRDWQDLDLVMGRTVALHSHDQTVTGVAAGVDGEGALLLKTPQGLKRFVSGDISLRIAG